MRKLRIVFMGTPDFAVASLEELLNTKHEVIAVITAPDKPAGRGKQLKASAVKEFAISKGIQVLQPSNLKSVEFIAELQQLKPDLQVVVAFRMLPEAVWSLPELGTINLHASLLPDYRGAAPINWAIINGESKTGVSTFLLKQEIDTGDILLQEEVVIEEKDNVGILHDKLMNVGSHLLVKTINLIADGNYTPIPQDKLIKHEPKHAPKIFKEDCKINWALKGNAINNFIRGLSPYPTAWTNFILNNREPVAVKIFSGSFITNIHIHKHGEVVIEKNELHIYCADGYINVKELQMAGKKRMSTQDFLRGISHSNINFIAI